MDRLGFPQAEGPTAAEHFGNLALVRNETEQIDRVRPSWSIRNSIAETASGAAGIPGLKYPPASQSGNERIAWRELPSPCGAPPMNPRDTLLATSSGSFALREWSGTGRDVLLVHGTGHNLEVWRPVAERLAADFRVVALDLRGHGQTPCDSTDAEQHWRDLAVIVAALRLQRPVLVGHSGGGYAVTAHAASGGTCAGLVIVDGFVPDSREAALRATGVVAREKLWDMFRYGWAATDEEKESWVQQVRATAPADWLNAGIDFDLVEAFTRRSFRRRGNRWLRRPTLEEIARLTQLKAKRPILPAVDVYDRLHVPAACVFATGGLYRERRAEVERIAIRISAPFVPLDAGHNVHMQRPADLAAVVRDLLI